MAVFTQIPEDTFQKLQLNAGVLLTEFDPATATVSNENIFGATSGGVSFTATPSYTDFGEDIDNCPTNMMELKKIESIEVTMSGTMLTVDTAKCKTLIGAADVSGNKITPRDYLTDDDFETIWWVGDYSDVNTGSNAGYIAIKLMNALNTGGLSLQSGDKAKGTFAFSFLGHYSMDAQDTVPYEVYIKSGTESE
jgi:hypothetical protein